MSGRDPREAASAGVGDQVFPFAPVTAVHLDVGREFRVRGDRTRGVKVRPEVSGHTVGVKFGEAADLLVKRPDRSQVSFRQIVVRLWGREEIDVISVAAFQDAGDLHGLAAVNARRAVAALPPASAAERVEDAGEGTPGQLFEA